MKFPDWREDKRVQRLHFWMGVRNLPTLPPIQFIREETREEKPTAIQKKEIALHEKLTKSSVDVNIQDLRVNNDAPLLHEGKQVLAYIYEQGLRYGNSAALLEGKSTYRFHLVWCQKLQEMKQRGRSARYRATRRIDGKAKVKPQDQSTKVVRMELCSYCRKALQAQGKYPTPFSFERYFEEYDAWDISHIPSNRSVVVQLEYAPDQAELSLRARQEVNWICQVCDVNLASRDYQRLLHLHHKDGIRNNNRLENLSVLCVDCHSQTHFHEHMKTEQAEDIALVRKIQREQGVRTPLSDESP